MLELIKIGVILYVYNDVSEKNFFVIVYKIVLMKSGILKLKEEFS